METFLFDKTIFGPINSRRLGISLGINLLPVNRKLCNFDCIYCECGFNDAGKGIVADLPSRENVFQLLENKLIEMKNNNSDLDVITFAGNGEPTLHPEFKNIIADTISLRQKYFASAKVSVLSNATMLHRPEVIESLKSIDQNILKLDSGIIETILMIDRPTGNFNLQKLIDQLKLFNGNFIIQTMFLRGNIDGCNIDNTTYTEVKALKDVFAEVKPQKIMIYSLDRNTPFDGLIKVSIDELKTIALDIEKLEIEVLVAG